MKRRVLLEVKNLSKSFKEIKAVDDISFSVLEGSLFSFLGPNGAGKSTTIKMIIALVEKDSGSFLLNGTDNKNSIRKQIGVVFQENVLDPDLSVKENLMLRGALYLKNKTAVKNRYIELVKKLELSDFENQRFKTLSGGQKRRVEIARALFSNPVLLLLDEPTTGLDPETRQMVWKVIDKLRKEDNITVFLTTHYMEEAANADYIVIIDKGKIKVEGTPDDLKELYTNDYLRIVPIDKLKLEETLVALNVDYVRAGVVYKIQVDSTKAVLSLIDEIKDNIKTFEVIKGTLDDVFINVIGKKYV
ncbi:MAG TPA: ABC transporter ATP-binding protein [Acholeplasma sp.]|nr:ABC transporter ATP-binding protein [Acholeplasma sp.]